MPSGRLWLVTSPLGAPTAAIANLYATFVAKWPAEVFGLAWLAPDLPCSVGASTHARQKVCTLCAALAGDDIANICADLKFQVKLKVRA